MIKEIEVSNVTEVLEDGLQLNDFENTPDIVSGVLTSNGAVMTVKINRSLVVGRFRKVALYFMVPEYSNQQVYEYKIGEYGPSDTVDETTDYIFSLSPVLSIIPQAIPEQLAYDSISVRLFTYESNITTDYGTKILSVPYTVDYPGAGVAPVSTDGWYALHVLDIASYDSQVNYVVDDIIYDGGLYKCLVGHINIPITDTATWVLLTSEEENNIYQLGYQPCSTISTLLNTDMLVTRHIKQKYLYDLLVSTGYKRHDNISAVAQVEKILAMREAAVVHLNAGNPIQAKHLLDMIVIEANSFMLNNGKANATTLATNFTI